MNCPCVGVTFQGNCFSYIDLDISGVDDTATSGIHSAAGNSMAPGKLEIALMAIFGTALLVVVVIFGAYCINKRRQEAKVSRNLII